MKIAGELDFNQFKGKNVADPLLAQDATNKRYVDKAGVSVYDTYADAYAALSTGLIPPGNLVRVRNDENNLGAGAWYSVQADTDAKVFDFDFTTQVYQFEALTLEAVDPVHVDGEAARLDFIEAIDAPGYYDMWVTPL